MLGWKGKEKLKKMSKIQLHPFAFYMSKCCLEFEATELVRVALSKVPSQFVAL